MKLASFFSALMFAVGAAAGVNAQTCIAGANAALSFDGVNDSVRVTNAPPNVIDGFLDFTIECWCRPIAPSAVFTTLVAKANTSTAILDRPYWLGLSTDLRPHFQMNWVPTYIDSPAPIPVNTWTHLAVSRSGSSITLFVDGAQVSNISFGTALNSSNGPLVFGMDFNNQFSTHSFAGNIDDVRVWNVARSQAQIQANMNYALTGSESGLVGYWRIDGSNPQQTVVNAATVGGSALDGTLGTTSASGIDDPAWTSTTAPLFNYCNSSGTGNANSADAGLTVNGIGAPTAGVYPTGAFIVAAPIQSTLTLDWNGPAVLPGDPPLGLVLFAGPLSVNSTTVPGLGTVDVGTFPAYSDVIIVFNGLTPPESFFFSLTANGTASQSFVVPNLPPGPVFAMQGIVAQPLGTSTFGVKLTAAFQIVVQ